MLIDDPSSCGIAFRGPTPKDKMFSVTNVFCASGHYSFAHEVGHNLVRLLMLLCQFSNSVDVGIVEQGCLHDRNADNKCTAADFAHGYRDPKSRFRSIMAYDCSRVNDKAVCDNNPARPCTRVLMFSNVEFEYNGMPIGNAIHNNAQQVKSAISTVANHYPCPLPSSSPTSLAPTVRPTRPATSAPTLRPSPPPTLARTPRPTPRPTRTPTLHPSVSPTAIPTLSMTPSPMQSPAIFPTYSITNASVFSCSRSGS